MALVTASFPAASLALGEASGAPGHGIQRPNDFIEGAELGWINAAAEP